MYAKYTQIGRYHELMLGTCCLSYICSLNPKYLTCTSIMVTTMTLSNNNTFTNIVNKILQIIDTLVNIFGNVDNIIVNRGGV